MTVNRLGTDPGLEGGQAASSSRTVADWLWPFLVGGLSLFSISALFYYHFHRLELEPTSFLQQLFAGLYDTFGWAPLVVFFLLVFAWSTIWFVTGVLERPGSRLTRLLVMAVMLGLFLNLGDGGVAQEPHKGAFGAWLATRLVAAVGYLPSLVLVWFTTFASLLLATDWFFSEWFERLRPAPSSDVGVEGEVTDHLRALGQDPTPAPNVDAAAVVSDAEPAPSTVLEAPAPAAEAAQEPEPQTSEAEPEPAQESYADRRRARAARRRARGERFMQAAEPESSGELSQESAPTEALTEAEVESFYEEPETEEVREPGGATELEEDLIVVAPEHVEAEELELEALERSVGDGAAEPREGGGHLGPAEVSEREVEVDLADDVDFAAETSHSEQGAASASGEEAEAPANDRAEGASVAASEEYAVTAGDAATAELEEEAAAEYEAESEDEAAAEYEAESEDEAAAEYEQESEDEADAEYEEESGDEADAEHEEEADDEGAAEDEEESKDEAAAEYEGESEDEADAEYEEEADDEAAAEYEEETEDEADAEYEEETEDGAAAEYEEETEDEADAEYEEETEDEADAEYEEETEDGAAAEYEEEADDEADAEYEEETEEEAAAEYEEESEDGAAAEYGQASEGEGVLEDENGTELAGPNDAQSVGEEAGELAEVDGAHVGDGAPEVAVTSEENPEAAIAIPRPEEPGEPSVPTPPAAPSERKQQLFFGGVDEDLVEEARELLGRGRRPSASMLQRKLRIDYELAQELLRELGQRGLLGADEPA